jgi:hypothetical protein
MSDNINKYHSTDLSYLSDKSFQIDQVASVLGISKGAIAGGIVEELNDRRYSWYQIKDPTFDVYKSGALFYVSFDDASGKINSRYTHIQINQQYNEFYQASITDPNLLTKPNLLDKYNYNVLLEGTSINPVRVNKDCIKIN